MCFKKTKKYSSVYELELNFSSSLTLKVKKN